MIMYKLNERHTENAAVSVYWLRPHRRGKVMFAAKSVKLVSGTNKSCDVCRKKRLINNKMTASHIIMII